MLIQLLLGARVSQLVAHMENQTAVLENLPADGLCTKQGLGSNPPHLDPVCFFEAASRSSNFLRLERGLRRRPLIPEVPPI